MINFGIADPVMTPLFYRTKRVTTPYFWKRTLRPEISDERRRSGCPKHIVRSPHKARQHIVESTGFLISSAIHRVGSYVRHKQTCPIQARFVSRSSESKLRLTKMHAVVKLFHELACAARAESIDLVGRFRLGDEPLLPVHKDVPPVKPLIRGGLVVARQALL